MTDAPITKLPVEYVCGFGLALAEMHRLLLGGNDSSGVRDVCRNANLRLRDFRRAGLGKFDVDELKKAGVK